MGIMQQCQKIALESDKFNNNKDKKSNWYLRRELWIGRSFLISDREITKLWCSSVV